MTNQSNPSLNVGFLSSLASPHVKQTNKFGTVSEIEGLAFDPETTGARILAETMVSKQVADRRDLESYKKVNKEVITHVENQDLERQLKEEEERVETEVDKISNGRPPAATHVVPDPGTLDLGTPEYERVIDLPDYLPAWFFEVGVERAKAVCKIETSGTDYEGNQGSWNGTGFLISPNILLTNHHVLNSKEVALKAVCLFNYETDRSGKVQSPHTYSLEPDKLFITSPVDHGLDFTACWIDPKAGEKFGFVPIFRHAFGIKNEDCANIVQHPDGRHKAIIVQKNEVYSQTDISVLYTSDTEPGSSGAFVCNNAWKLIALHHASRKIRDADITNNKKAVYVNEGIKMSAIAVYLEGLVDSDRDYSAARQVLQAFNGVDSAMGYFGSLGRQRTVSGAVSDLERVQTSYRGEEKDLDICFWNIEWFNKNYLQKIKDVAWEISVQNLDVWVISESSKDAAEELVKFLNNHYQLEYAALASEPNASPAKQATTIIWNTRTVDIQRKEWPNKVEKWLSLTSENFKDLGELQNELELEAVDGKIFDRYPALFQVAAKNNLSGQNFSFHLVPLHLKAMPEGSKRRRFACQVLAQAIQYSIELGIDSEWIIGGDLNATLASGDLQELSNGKLVAMSASDAAQNAFSYLKKPHQSLIDHIYLSPNLTKSTDKDGFMILARERDTTRDGNTNSNYLNISDHRPVMIRLSLADGQTKADAKASVTPDFMRELEDIYNRVASRSEAGKDVAIVNKEKQPVFTKDQALSLVVEARRRPYYDQSTDTAEKKQYYKNLPTGLSPDALFKYFSQLITSTHTTQLPYKPAIYVYPWVDLQEDLTLVNLYSGEATDPEVLIEADFRIDDSEMEAQGLYNCEHVVPQSWFNKANPQRGDLHHLFACTPQCNSFRGNIPYVEFPDWEERVMDNCGNREGNGFEPKRAKGIVARATLYFMLRYPQVTVQYKASGLTTLIAWHLEEPVSKYELHRNAAIYELQGNRNPFIDFAKLASKLEFQI